MPRENVCPAAVALEQSYGLSVAQASLLSNTAMTTHDTEVVLKIVAGGVRYRAQSSRQHKYLLSQVWLINSANVLAPRFWVSYGLTI